MHNWNNIYSEYFMFWSVDLSDSDKKILHKQMLGSVASVANFGLC